MVRYMIDEIRKIISSIEQKYGAERVYLFSPYACGKASDDSDEVLLYVG